MYLFNRIPKAIVINLDKILIISGSDSDDAPALGGVTEKASKKPSKPPRGGSRLNLAGFFRGFG